MSRQDDRSLDDSQVEEDEALSRSIQRLFATEDRAQPGDELRSMRMATRAAAAFVKPEQDGLRESTLQAFARETPALPDDAALAVRMAVRAVHSASVAASPTPVRRRSRHRLGMPLALSTLLISSGVLAASVALVVKVVVPVVSLSRVALLHKAERRLRPSPAIKSEPHVAVAPQAVPVIEPELAPPAEAPVVVAVKPRAHTRHVSVSAAQLFATANRQRRAGQVRQAEASYKRIISGFGNAPEAGLSRLSLSDLAMAGGRRGEALAHLNAFLSGAQTPALIEEALQRKARVLAASHRGTEASAAWRELRERFPRSVYRVEADRYLQSKPSDN